MLKTVNPIVAAAALLGALVLTAPAAAQQKDRDPAYAAARAAGQVGEKTDGYLGYPVPPSPEIRRMAEDINIKRRAVYARKAAENKVTVEDYAFTSACLLIADTDPGEKYQSPTGAWLTRTDAPPQRDSRCP